MSQEELQKLILKLEKSGVMRALLFLREKDRMTNDFEEIMAMPTWTNTARPVLLDLGLIEITDGEKRRRIHSLTERGKRVSELLLNLLNEVGR